MKRSFALCLLLVLSRPMLLLADQPPAGINLWVGAGAGSHHSDLEPRYRDDKLFGSLLSGGFGTNLDWEGTSGGSSTLGASYRAPEHWFLQFESSVIVTQPSYIGFYSVGGSGLSASSFETVKLNPLSRSTADYLAGYNVVINPQMSLDFMGGFRSAGQYADYEIMRINQFSSGALSISQLEVSTEARTEGRAMGLIFGGVLRFKLQTDIEITGGALFYSLAGRTELDYTTVKASSAGGALALRHEDGNWEVSGLQWMVSLRYGLAPTWTLFGTFRRDSSTVQDSQVINYNFSSDSSFASSNSLLGFILTYAGSAQREDLTRFDIGIEKRFDL